MVNTKAAAEIAHLPDIVEFAIEKTERVRRLAFPANTGMVEPAVGSTRPSLERGFMSFTTAQTKDLFDPEHLLNPGIITGAGSMTADLRFGSEYHAQELRTNLDFSDDLGFCLGSRNVQWGGRVP